MHSFLVKINDFKNISSELYCHLFVFQLWLHDITLVYVHSFCYSFPMLNSLLSLLQTKADSLLHCYSFMAPLTEPVTRCTSTSSSSCIKFDDFIRLNLALVAVTKLHIYLRPFELGRDIRYFWKPDNVSFQLMYLKTF